ncbi:MAG: hypothetical protein ACI4RP_00765 [Acutalibacteraceae bacterium]
MKCECGKEFEGNFCPVCGKRAYVDIANYSSPQKEEEPKKTDEKNGVSDEVKDVLKCSVLMYLKFRLKFIFLGAFLVAVIAFLAGKFLSGIIFTLCGIILLPPVIKRFPKKYLWSLIAIVVGCIILGAMAWGPLEDTYSSTTSGYSEVENGYYVSDAVL